MSCRQVFMGRFQGATSQPGSNSSECASHGHLPYTRVLSLIPRHGVERWNKPFGARSSLPKMRAGEGLMVALGLRLVRGITHTHVHVLRLQAPVMLA
jgi:hypothetical protein